MGNHRVPGTVAIEPIFKLVNPSQALSAFPATLNFVPGTFTTLAGSNSGLASPYGISVTQYQISEDLAMMDAIRLARLWPLKGGLPVAIWYISSPSAKMSV